MGSRHVVPDEVARRRRGGEDRGAGKVWKKADPEPADWTLVYEDSARIAAGSPGVYGDSSVDIDWDNLSVVVNR